MNPTDDDQPTAKGMSDAELCALIERESSNALGYDDTLATVRKTGLEFYLGEAKGELSKPAVDGRSGVVSKDLMDTVEWIMPSMMRLFTGTDEVARFEPDGPEDEQGAKDATHAVQHVVMEQNEGFRVLHDAIKNCLIQRMGVVKVYCDHASEQQQERYSGLSEWDMEALSSDPDIQIVSQTPGEVVIGPDGQPVQLVDVVCSRTFKKKKYVVEGVPPEEFGMSKEAKSLEDARYCEHKVDRTASELKSMGYDPDTVDGLFGDDGRFSGQEQQERGSIDDSWSDNDEDGDESQRRITLTECYIRCDFDGDGISEYRRVVKAGTEILENEVTDENPFALFTPVLMPYRAIGLSVYDLVEDIQRIKTALTRQTLDSAYLANNPRTEVLENGVNLDDLLNPRPGGLVRVKAMGNIREISNEFVGESGLKMIDYFNRVRDARTGVTEFNQGLGGAEMAGTAIGSNGVQDMMASAVQRIELMARVIAETGVKRLWRLVLKVLTQYQDKPMQLKVNGRWLQVDPREWRNGYRTTISVGVAATSRQAQIGNLNNILLIQERVQQFGLANPANVYATLSRLTEQMGYRDSGQFWSNPETNPPPPPQPPEAVQVEQLRQQGKAQEVQTKAQADIQVETMKQRAQAEQAQQETQLEAERNRIQMENDMRMEQFKVEKAAELEMFKARLHRQTELDKAGIAAGNILPSGEASSPVHDEVKALAAAVAELRDHATQPKPRRAIHVVRDENGRIVGAQEAE